MTMNKHNLSGVDTYELLAGLNPDDPEKFKRDIQKRNELLARILANKMSEDNVDL